MRFTAARLTVLTLLAACTGETTTTPSPSLITIAASHAQAEKPIRGSCQTRFDPPPFPLPAVHRQTDVGTCKLSQLGAADFYAVQDIEFATGTQRSVVVRITAANGDVLLASSVGSSTASGPVVQFSATLSFEGGTGRFANATGQATITGRADLLTNTAQLDITDGWLNYDAASRSN